MREIECRELISQCRVAKPGPCGSSLRGGTNWVEALRRDVWRRVQRSRPPRRLSRRSRRDRPREWVGQGPGPLSFSSLASSFLTHTHSYTHSLPHYMCLCVCVSVSVVCSLSSWALFMGVGHENLWGDESGDIMRTFVIVDDHLWMELHKRWYCVWVWALV